MMHVSVRDNSIVATDSDHNVTAQGVAGVDDAGFIRALISGGHKDFVLSGAFRAASPDFIRFQDMEGCSIRGERASLENISILSVDSNDVSIRDLKMSGATENGFIYIYNGNDAVVERIQVRDASGPAFAAIYAQIPDNTTNRNHYYNDCVALDGNKHGFAIWGDDWKTAIANNFHYNRCEAHRCGLVNSMDNWTVGFNLSEAITANHLVVTDCKATYCWESGFHMEGRGIYNDVTFARCLAEFNGQKPDPTFGNGFLVGGVRIVDCIAKNNHGLKWGTGCGIRILQSEGHTICSGNITSGNDGSGIYVDSGKGPCIVSGNISDEDAYGIFFYGPEDGSGLPGSAIQGNVIRAATNVGIRTLHTPAPVVQGNYVL